MHACLCHTLNSLYRICEYRRTTAVCANTDLPLAYVRKLTYPWRMCGSHLAAVIACDARVFVSYTQQPLPYVRKLTYLWRMCGSHMAAVIACDARVFVWALDSFFSELGLLEHQQVCLFQ